MLPDPVAIATEPTLRALAVLLVRRIMLEDNPIPGATPTDTAGRFDRVAGLGAGPSPVAGVSTAAGFSVAGAADAAHGAANAAAPIPSATASAPTRPTC
ncbi:hypothetical protein DVS77_16980 [Mycolicibacterium moriokaense]|nr:hypothetical protein DVS77_16980 [Mycolicibacterium moriokaense]